MAAGLNQREVGERLGLTTLYVSRCERGERRMDVLELRDYCRAIEISFSQFIQQLDRQLDQDLSGGAL